MSKKRIVRRIGGMHCVRCENAVQKALSDLPGLENVTVSYARGTMTADWDEAILPETEIQNRLRAAGYDFRRTNVPREILKFVILLAVCGGLFELILRNPVVSRLNLFPTADAGMSFGALFLLGLMTSLHCIAMCGGINLSQSGRSAVCGGGLWKSNLQYNLGRLISYTITGCIIGAIGSVFRVDARVKAALEIVAAIFMVIMACNLAGLFPWMQRFAIRMPKKFISRFPILRGDFFSFGVGLLNGLMPCGPLQSMQLFALSVGSWWMGGLAMFCFAAGTIPAMLGFGFVGGMLNRRFGRPLQWISGALVLFMGISMMVNGASLAGISTQETNRTQAVAEIASDGGMQKFDSELEWNSYPDFTVYAGVPLQWTIHASKDKLIGCNNEILIPAYDVDVHLHEGDNLIEFTPTESGTVGYSCWMGMIRATITVIDP